MLSLWANWLVTKFGLNSLKRYLWPVLYMVIFHVHNGEFERNMYARVIEWRLVLCDHTVDQGHQNQQNSTSNISCFWGWIPHNHSESV